jgi:hypothetical protein
MHQFRSIKVKQAHVIAEQSQGCLHPSPLSCEAGYAVKEAFGIDVFCRHSLHQEKTQCYYVICDLVFNSKLIHLNVHPHEKYGSHLGFGRDDLVFNSDLYNTQSK